MRRKKQTDAEASLRLRPCWHGKTLPIHGETALQAAEHISQAFFTGHFGQLTTDEFQQLEQDGIPMTEMADRLSLSALLVKTGLANSNRQAREFIQNGAIAVNSDVFKHDELAEIFPLHDRYLVLKRGKNSFIW